MVVNVVVFVVVLEPEPENPGNGNEILVDQRARLPYIGPLQKHSISCNKSYLIVLINF